MKKFQIALAALMVVGLFITGCASEPAAPSSTAPAVDTPAEIQAGTTGESSVDDVAAEVSDAATLDEELDTSELDDIDSMLSDIENI